MYFLNIVNLLRERNLNPSCFSPAYQQYDANIIFKYNEPVSKYLHVETTNSRQWIQIDLQSIVSISGYMIYEKEGCHWLSEWDFEISFDGKQFKNVHHNDGYANGSTFRLHPRAIGRYIKMTGSAKECDSIVFAIQRLFLFGDISIHRNTIQCKYQFFKSVSFITIQIFIYL